MGLCGFDEDDINLHTVQELNIEHVSRVDVFNLLFFVLCSTT